MSARLAVTPATPQQTWIGDGQPFDRERVKRAILECERRIFEDIVSAGSYLLWAKAEMPHGEFMRWLDDLGMGWDTANRYMRVARAANSATLRNLVAAGDSPSKMYELCTVPEDVAAAAAESGEFLGRPLNEISRMPVRELRAELRALKKSKESPAAPSTEPPALGALLDQNAQSSAEKHLGKIFEQAINAYDHIARLRDMPDTLEKANALHRALNILCETQTTMQDHITEVGNALEDLRY